LERQISSKFIGQVTAINILTDVAFPQFLLCELREVRTNRSREV
jgi:hypothetical protein